MSPLARIAIGALAVGCAPDDAFVPVPIGQISSGSIGPAGGTLVSSDSEFWLNVPAGALSSDVELSVQRIEWDNGKGYVIGPEGTSFNGGATAFLTVPSEFGTWVNSRDLDGVVSVSFVGTVVHAFALDEPPSPRGPNVTLTRDVDGYGAEGGPSSVAVSVTLNRTSIVGVTATGTDDQLRHTEGAYFAMGNEFPVEVSRSQTSWTGALPWWDGKRWRTQPDEYVNVLTEFDFHDEGTIVAPAGDVVVADAPPTSGAWRPFECSGDGYAEIDMSWTHSVETTDGVPVTAFQAQQAMLARCAYHVVANCQATDPVDMGSDGAVSLDLVCGKTGTQVYTDRRPWALAEFDGLWPPQPYYEWSSAMTFIGSSGILGTVEADGEDFTTLSSADLPAGTWSALIYPFGYGVVLGSAYDGLVTSVEMTSAVRRTAGGPLVEDSLPITFDATDRFP